VLLPIGNNVEEYWNLINGVSGAALITYFDPAKFRTHLHAN
jgi:3-oxoacyl-[acyl-carrier-protein] synthase II